MLDDAEKALAFKDVTPMPPIVFIWGSENP